MLSTLQVLKVDVAKNTELNSSQDVTVIGRKLRRR